jgi:uncharacterized protein (DUF362 family)
MVRRLGAPHQTQPFTQFQPLNAALRAEVFSAVSELFNAAGGRALLKSSGDVYIKPNAIDSKPYCHTRPELVEAVIRYWKEAGANQIYLFENATQCNFTRMVFALTGYSAICRRYGVTEVYLDEEESVEFTFRGKSPEEKEAGGYAQTTFMIPKFITERLITHAGENLYISLPKLKTHSMAGVTLGVKNQWAFPQHNDRRPDHNYNLPYKLADVLGYVQPDYTLIEGVEATVNGHYPPLALADRCVLPFRVLIGSTNVVAADLVGARLFGLGLEDAAHLRLAIERGYSRGVRGLEDIELTGDISDFNTRYGTDIVQEFPADVSILRGKERLCVEGCQNNPLSVMQTLALDYGGKGGWTMVMGKGHNPAEIDAIQGRVLVVGHCAIHEVGGRLKERLGKKNVYFSGYCNDLCATTNALCNLMHVNPMRMAPMGFARSVKLLALAKLHGTRANVPFPWADKIKVV